MNVNFFKTTAAVLMIATISLAGYAHIPNGTMAMTTAKEGKVVIGLAGMGTATIDWDDGSTPEKITLSTFAWELTDSHVYIHTFSGTTSRTITIEGQNITVLGCSGLELTAINVNKNTALTFLSCFQNKLMRKNVSKNTALTELWCYNNQLTNFDVSKRTTLTELNCISNHLESLDVSKNTTLTYLYCGDNDLENLDVSNNTALTELKCDQNYLMGLDLTKNTALAKCGLNQLEAIGLNALFSTLPGNDGNKTIAIGNPRVLTITLLFLIDNANSDVPQK